MEGGKYHSGRNNTKVVESVIPYLYPQSQEKIPLNGYNSIGRLSECISCKITEDLSGVYEMELKYPKIGRAHV